MEFSERMTIGTVLKTHPAAAKVVKKYMIHCLNCKGADKEPIFRGAQIHGVDTEKVLQELNKLQPAKKE